MVPPDAYDSVPTVRSYSAFGLDVMSELALDGFVPRETSAEEDVRVVLGEPPHDGDGGRHAMAYAKGVLTASIRDGRDVVVAPSPGADARYVSAVVTGELFSVVLRQRGLLVLHGSAVAKAGRAVCFVGDSGWGKSTLAASLVERGWQLLTDDLLVVAGLGSEAPPTAVPTHPSMRLSEEALSHVEGGGVAKGQAHALTQKVRVDQAAAFSDRPTPLAQVWVLDPRPTDAHASRPLTGLAAIDEVVRHTRGKRLLNARSFKAALLTQAADLVKRVPVASLRRQFGLDHVGALCDLVEAEVDA